MARELRAARPPAAEEARGSALAIPREEGVTLPPRGMAAETWRRFLRSRTGLAGLALVGGLFLFAALAGWLAPYPYDSPAGETLRPPSLRHPFGTDPLGRDMFSRVLHGTRVALFVGLGSIVLAFAVGIPLGVASGYYGGWLDVAVMRLMELLLAFPTFLLAMLVMVVLGPSTANVVVALAIVRVPIFARLVRGSVLLVRELEYVQGAKAASAPDRRILFRHILPNCLPPIIVMASLSTAFAILVEASLSFLGLGTQPPTPSWGFDLKQNLTSLEENPSIVFAPGAAIMFTVLGFNLFGDGLRDALDPRLRD